MIWKIRRLQRKKKKTSEGKGKLVNAVPVTCFVLLIPIRLKDSLKIVFWS